MESFRQAIDPNPVLFSCDHASREGIDVRNRILDAVHAQCLGKSSLWPADYRTGRVNRRHSIKKFAKGIFFWRAVVYLIPVGGDSHDSTLLSPIRHIAFFKLTGEHGAHFLERGMGGIKKNFSSIDCPGAAGNGIIVIERKGTIEFGRDFPRRSA